MTSFWLIAVLGMNANLRLIGVVAVILGIIASMLRIDLVRSDQKAGK